MRPMFGPFVPSTSVTFVSQASLGNVAKYKLQKRVEAVKGCRSVGKKDMKFNDTMPKMSVDPESYRVEADGKHCEAEPAEKLPLGQAYFVF
jgi:urease